MNETKPAGSLSRMADIGGRIRRVREHLERTQEQFASELGVERGAVGNWETGKRPSLGNLYKIYQKTSVPMEWFMEGEDDRPIPFLDAASRAVRIAGDLSLTLDEAASVLTAIFQALRSSIPEAEARVAARAAIKAFRTPPAPPRLSLSEEERRSAVLEAIRLFLPE